MLGMGHGGGGSLLLVFGWGMKMKEGAGCMLLLVGKKMTRWPQFVFVFVFDVFTSHGTEK